MLTHCGHFRKYPSTWYTMEIVAGRPAADLQHASIQVTIVRKSVAHPIIEFVVNVLCCGKCSAPLSPEALALNDGA